MTFLSPLGLVGLASVPVLIWLWRFAASRHQTVLPSLVPFEHLLRRPPTRRTQLLANLLFWLQAAALVLASLSLAEPMLLTARTRTVLVLLDTSASMGASVGGPSPFQRATRALSARLARKRQGQDPPDPSSRLGGITASGMTTASGESPEAVPSGGSVALDESAEAGGMTGEETLPPQPRPSTTPPSDVPSREAV